MTNEAGCVFNASAPSTVWPHWSRYFEADDDDSESSVHKAIDRALDGNPVYIGDLRHQL